MHIWTFEIILSKQKQAQPLACVALSKWKSDWNWGWNQSPSALCCPVLRFCLSLGLFWKTRLLSQHNMLLLPQKQGVNGTKAIWLALTSRHSHDFTDLKIARPALHGGKLAANFVCSDSWWWSPTTQPNPSCHPRPCSVCAAHSECRLMHWPLSLHFCSAQRAEDCRRRTECCV